MTMTILETDYRSGCPDTVPVVLVHAFPVDHRVWDACAASLCEQGDAQGVPAFDVMALEMPGAGRCPIPDAGETGPADPDGAYPEAMDRMAEAFVRRFLAGGHTRAVWVGISMGGYLTLAVHRLHPEVVAGVVLCDTKAANDGPEARAGRLAIADECEAHDTVSPVMHFARPQAGDSAFKRSEACVRMFTDWINDQDPRGVAWRERMAAGRPDETAQLPLIRVPAGLVSGTLDGSSAPDVMRPLAARMTGTDCVFTEVEDAGHFTCVEKPAEVAAAILDVQRRAQAPGVVPASGGPEE